MLTAMLTAMLAAAIMLTGGGRSCRRRHLSLID